MVRLYEDFKPVKSFTGYLGVFTILVFLVLYICLTVWIPPIFLDINPAMFIPLWVLIAVIAVGIIIWILVWSSLYYKTVVYQLNTTEIIWKRGVFFRQTGIVPYNRITNVDIVQGPLMRIFGVYNLKIDTAAGSGNNKAEIRLEGMSDPEPLRAMIMDFVRGSVPACSAVEADYTSSEKSADIRALTAEVREIRKLLENRK